VRPLTQAAAPLPPAALGGDTIDAGTVAPSGGAYAAGAPQRSTDPAPTRHVWRDQYDDGTLGVLSDGGYVDPPTGETDIDEDGGKRHRFVVIGLPLIALVVVVALAVWLGKSVLSVAGNVDDVEGSTPTGATSAGGPSSSAAPTAGAPIPIVGAGIFDPGGDGDPENPETVDQAFDGDAATAWSTFTYRGSPAFGNLKDGVGLVLDLGSSQSIAAVELTSTAPGATVEIRVAEEAGTALDQFTPAAAGTVEGTTPFAFEEAATARYVLVWITGLVATDGGFAADLAEIKVQAAG